MRLRSLNLVLTTGCNLRCAYCYQARGPKRWMAASTVSAAIGLLLRLGGRRVRLGFYGGEPLLAFPTLRAAVLEMEGRRERGRSVEYLLTTNGTLMGAEEAGFLERHGVEVRLSFDGVPEAQRLRGRESHEVLDGLLSRLARDHEELFRRHLSVAMTLVPESVEFLARGVAYLLAKGVRRIGIEPATQQCSSWDGADMARLEGQFARLLELVRSHHSSHGEVPLALFGRRAPSSLAWAMDLPICGLQRLDSLVVDVDGGLHGCELLAESYREIPEGPLGRELERLGVGRLGTPGLGARLERRRAEVSELGVFRRRRSKYSSYGTCGECPEQGWCRVCPLSIVWSAGNGDPDRIPDFACAFYRTAGRYRRRFQEGLVPALSGGERGAGAR